MNAIQTFVDRLKQNTGVEIALPSQLQNVNMTLPDPQKVASTLSGIGQVNQYNPYNMPSLKMQMNSRKTGESLLSSFNKPSTGMQ
jgi:hypothetical protein